MVQLADFRDPLDECAADADRGAVRRAINRLPPHYARILELRFGDELKVPEIAARAARFRKAPRNRSSAAHARHSVPNGCAWRTMRRCRPRRPNVVMHDE